MKIMSYALRAFVFCGIVLLSAPAIAGAASSDASINQSVQDSLMSGGKNFDATNIIVNTEDGVVNLRGSARSDAEVKRIEDAAKLVPGVKAVESQIDVLGDSQS